MRPTQARAPIAIWIVTTCFVGRNPLIEPRHPLQGLQRLGVPTPAVMKIIVQKPLNLLALPTIDLHERLEVTQSSFKCSLKFRVSSVRRLLVHESLHFGDQTKSTGLSCYKYLHNLSVFVLSFWSQHLRGTSKANRGVKPMRLAMAIVLRWPKLSAT